jgi:aldose 1-epimerase
MTPRSDSPLILSAHGFEATLHPEAGATLSRLTWTQNRRAQASPRHDLLFCPPEAVPDVREPNRFGMWPMVPFANRAFGGLVNDGETSFQVALNHPELGLNMHGFGWQSAWQAADHTSDAITLVHTRLEGSDPYRYEARFEMRLEQGCVRFGLSVTNLADRTLPFGSGLHPWFPTAADTQISFAAAGAVAFAPGFRPLGDTVWDGGGPYAAGRRRAAGIETVESALDWTGPAVFATPSLGLAITVEASPGWRHPVLWSPPDAAFVCFEPQSHVIGAPSELAARQLTPLLPLAPGETFSSWMTLTPSVI